MKNFKCRQCGNCCHTFTLCPIEPWEADELGVEHVCQEANDSQLQLRKKKVDGLPSWAVDGVCVFYDNGCTVHDRKPELCKRFSCGDGRLAAMVFAIAQGIYHHGEMSEEEQHEAMVLFMKNRMERL